MRPRSKNNKSKPSGKTIKSELTISSITQYGNVFRVECKATEPLPKIAAGQFAHIKVPGKDLRRPICVYDNTADTISFIIASVGAGTAAFTAQQA
ncbi:MAG: hypothetical protein OSJ83_12685, partial [Clostridia bacterium]|nr:hypothetical protein [Clostridia bacterium]